MKIKAIICDIGGVLVQSVDTSKRRIWEDRLSLNPGELFKLVYQVEPADRATLGMVESATIWKDIAAKYSLTESELASLRKDFYEGDMLNKEFYAYMKKMRLKYKTALLSNAWENAREMYTDKYHLDTLFDVMIISAEVGMQKPDKKIFTYALELLKVTAGEAIFIDDTIDNCRAAEKIGMHTIAFADTETVISKMKKLLVNNYASSDQFDPFHNTVLVF